MKSTLLGALVICAVACGGSSPKPKDASEGPEAGGSAAGEAGKDTGSGGLKEVPAADPLIVFEGYDGPNGAMRELGQYAWTVVPRPGGDHPAGCTFQVMELGRVPVIGKKGDRVVLGLTDVPECHFAMPPAIVVDDDTGPLEKGAAILYSHKDIAWFGRVADVQGDEVSYVLSPGTAIESKFDAKKPTSHKTARANVRAVHDGLGFGARVMVPNGPSVMLHTMFASTDDAVYVTAPFGTKYAQSEVSAAMFEKPLEVGQGVFATYPDGGYLRQGKVIRTNEGLGYEVQAKEGDKWATGYEDLMRGKAKKKP